MGNLGARLLQEITSGGEEAELLAQALGMAGDETQASGEAEEDPEIRQTPWPDPPAEEAYHGLAGEIVLAIEPHTEADPVGLLGQFLVAFGNCVGRNAFFQVEADKHFGNLYCCLVGATAKARKGTSWGHIRRLFEIADPDWLSNCIASGLSSGEGLVWAIRDPIPSREDPEVLEDPGVSDKRLLIFEGELASVLAVLKRQGNNLSAIIRDLWDRGSARSLTKNSPSKVTGGHVSIIAHVTKAEVTRHLDTTEVANGLANRFIWLCVRRSKCLPLGGNISDVDFQPLLDRLKKAIEFGRNAGQVSFSETAQKAWCTAYQKLSEDRPGMLGAVTARAEAQVLRLSLLYALLDLSPTIRVEHLRAALALWEYAKASAEFIFGNRLGDPVADEILKALRETPLGLTRTDIYSGLFSRHVPKKRIADALETLLGAGLVKMEKEPGGEGRPKERWLAVNAQFLRSFCRPKTLAAQVNALNALNAQGNF